MNRSVFSITAPWGVIIFTAVLFCSLLLSSCTALPGKDSSSAAGTRTEDSLQTGRESSADTASAKDPEDSSPPEDPQVPAGSQAAQTAAGTTAEDTAESSDTAKRPDRGSVSEEALRISDKYGIRILLADEVPLSYTDYTAAVLEDHEKISAALKELDLTLGLYPPGFFTSVKEGFCDSITICLARDLHAINDDTYIESANAFTTVQDNIVWLVLNADEPLGRGTLIHELTHVIDYRLLGMNQMQETEWNLLNPPSFSYYNAYLDEDGEDLRVSGSTEYTAMAEEDAEKIWFWDSYSKTFAMEDRARLMEKLMDDIPDESGTVRNCFSSSHIQTKLRFYFYTLRQAFENARWPEETVWEARLRRAAP